MKKKEWSSSKSIEKEFLDSLNKLLKYFLEICKASGGDQEEYKRRMNNFQNSYAYERFVHSSVKRMVTPLATKNYSTWRKAARKATRSRTIYLFLMREIKSGLQSEIDSQIIENASLIKTLPNDVAQKVVKDISDKTFEGLRASEIAKLIRDKTDQHARASAKLIARTEVSKTTTALCKARSEHLGINWYVWRTALDGNRVRKSHQIMEGVLVNWHNPPSPEALAGEKSVGNYHAGEIWNCRCYPEPLLEIDDVKWPCKVYYNGQITSMRKQEFEQIQGG